MLESVTWPTFSLYLLLFCIVNKLWILCCIECQNKLIVSNIIIITYYMYEWECIFPHWPRVLPNCITIKCRAQCDTVYGSMHDKDSLRYIDKSRGRSRFRASLSSYLVLLSNKRVWWSRKTPIAYCHRSSFMFTLWMLSLLGQLTLTSDS